MNRISLVRFVFISLSLLLTACQGSTTQEIGNTPSPTSEDTLAIAASPTLPPAATDAPGCSVASLSLPSERPADSRFPAVGPQDWAHGKADAKITIIEYGDFQ